MEATCNRCHQSVPADSCFCPACGLPQLVYESDEAAATTAERWTGAVHDAATVEWRPALRVAMLLAVPTGLLSCGQSPVWPLSLLWMAAASAWAVTLYARRQRPGWVTMGAGARIGLVTGLLAGWFAFAASGAALYAMRFLFGAGKEFDDPWQAVVAQASQQWQSMSPDAQTAAAFKSITRWLLTPEGRAGSVLGLLTVMEMALLLFAVAGGAIGARLMARRRPQA
jgi:RNA polymerase subunit RPABC4/transcription elongation factor Spt4